MKFRLAGNFNFCLTLALFNNGFVNYQCLIPSPVLFFLFCFHGNAVFSRKEKKLFFQVSYKERVVDEGKNLERQ